MFEYKHFIGEPAVPPHGITDLVKTIQTTIGNLESNSKCHLQ